MSGRRVFVSYAAGGFLPARDALCASALAAGFDEARPRGPADLDPGFAARHATILSDRRGAGYWLWKPQIILQELRSLTPGDLLVYSDAGRSGYYRFRRFPARLAARAQAAGFLLGPSIGQHGPMAHWTKRDAFVLLDMDRAEIHARAPVQATWSFWTPDSRAFEFLDAWRGACADPRILTDLANTQGLDNLPGFRDHRHDQAALSLLAFRHGAPYLDYAGRLPERILRLRPQSRLAHLFLKRIEDAEAVARHGLAPALVRSWRDLRREGQG